MAWYDYPGNFSNGSSVEGIGSLFQYMNDLTNINNNPDGGIIGFVLMWIIWAIAFFTVRGVSSSTKAFASASFMAFALSIWFVRMSILSSFWVMIMGLLVCIGIILARGEARLGL